MVAGRDTRSTELVDLRHMREDRLLKLLEEETATWTERLHWNFRPSADLVTRYVSMHALDGFALVEDGEPIGYSYFVAEDRKGLIGDLFIAERRRTPEREQALLNGVLQALFANPLIRRVEAQLMMLDTEHVRPVREPERFERHFLCVPLAGMGRLAERRTHGVLYEPWSMRCLEDAGRLIADVYRRHVDSRINDQYRSAAGARRFLQNIVQYPGCGQFQQPASYTALDGATGRLIGISLASIVAPEVGHITQICVDEAHQGMGVGYELLRRTLTSLILERCTEATLTVTAANAQALELYHRLGFYLLRQFDALVWENV